MAKHHAQPERAAIRFRKDNPHINKIIDLLLKNKKHKPDEICVIFKNKDSAPSNEDIEEVKAYLSTSLNLNPADINIRKCDSCNCPVVLFQGNGLHTLISGDGVDAGSVSKTKNVEEFSLNFYKEIPADQYTNTRNWLLNAPITVPPAGKDKIIVAVLDTGIDLNLINRQYLWTKSPASGDPACYRQAKHGWNFVDPDATEKNEEERIWDDSASKHGTTVSQFIINEFQKAANNTLQIMPLKTHDAQGRGDLFGILCAIYFAMVNGANIINASRGFYYYYQNPFRSLSKLIVLELQKRGILFITAAGNQFPNEEVIATQIYKLENDAEEGPTTEQLRNLDFHKFYPAHLSRGEDEAGEEQKWGKNNVITVTTTDENEVSPTQNFSNNYVDLGVMRDITDKDLMYFNAPFPGYESERISGSSFATAIATGIIGAYCSKEFLTGNLDKSELFKSLESKSATKGSPKFLVYNTNLEDQIREGKYLVKLPPKE